MKKLLSLLCFLSLLVLVISPDPPVLAEAREPLSKLELPSIKLILPEGKTSVQKVILLDNGLQLVVTLRESITPTDNPLRTTIRRTLTSESTIRSADGTELGSITAVGVFDTNGSTSDPEDAYGYGEVKRYSIENPSNTLSNEQFYAWVRVTFKGVPVGPVQPFTYNCTINCDANGNYSASWV